MLWGVTHCVAAERSLSPLAVMKIHADAPSEEVQIQIIPLIDVIFCILTFFILAALQFTRQQAIKVDLPRASTGAALPGVGLGDNRFREMMMVTIGPSGQTFIDQTPVDRGQLAQLFQNYIAQNPNGILVLNASPSAFYNDVVQVLDLMRSVGGSRVALATVPGKASPTPGTTPQTPGTTPFPTNTPTFNPFDPFGTSTPAPDNGLATPSPVFPGGGTEGTTPGEPAPNPPGESQN